MNQTDWRGVFPALTTKFTEDGGLDYDAMERHLEFQLEAGAHGIIVLGSLGENSTLTAKEKRDLTAFFAACVDGRVPLLSCIAECATDEAVDLEYLADNLWFVGSPERVADRILDLQERTGGFGHLLIVSYDATNELPAWERSLTLLMDEVLPRCEASLAKEQRSMEAAQ